MAATYLHIAMTTPTAGSDEEFNRWYDTVHIPEVLQMPGFQSGQRYRLVTDDPTDEPRYIAVYEVESDDIEATVEMIARLAPGRTKSPAIDTRKSIVRTYEALGDRQLSAPTPLEHTT
jgi:hypothetical protein